MPLVSSERSNERGARPARRPRRDGKRGRRRAAREWAATGGLGAARHVPIARANEADLGDRRRQVSPARWVDWIRCSPAADGFTISLPGSATRRASRNGVPAQCSPSAGSDRSRSPRWSARSSAARACCSPWGTGCAGRGGSWCNGSGSSSSRRRRSRASAPSVRKRSGRRRSCGRAPGRGPACRSGRHARTVGRPAPRGAPAAVAREAATAQSSIARGSQSTISGNEMQRPRPRSCRITKGTMPR